MRHVQLSYDFSDKRQHGSVRNALADLLHAVQEQGSISGAARLLGLSYRHVWGELRRWEKQLAHPLIVWEKGQRARLAPFGEKLLWAERQAQARLAPQIEALHAELERAFAVAFDDAAQVLTLFASHDDGLSLLRGLAVAQARLHLDVRFCGSVDAIAALNAGRCTLAGFHSSQQPGLGSRTQRSYQPLLQPGRHKLIGFAERSQGLMVAPGNPLGLSSMADVARRRARFVNRAAGSGTRLLCDELLDREQVAPADVSGYDREEPSHAAVAQAVASGSADAGVGIEAAARSRGLEFVPLLSERYYLVCLKEALEEPPIASLRRVLQSEAWQRELAGLAGYAPWKSGEVLSLKAQLPWWDLPPKRADWKT
jgi:putative molybdopterin biosynthesis protein